MQDLCTLHERALQHSLQRWPLLFCSRGGKKGTIAATLSRDGFRYAGHLLGQNPHAEATVAGIETKIHQLACAAFHIFRSGAVFKNDERVSRFKKETSKDEVGFYLVLLTVDNMNKWLVVHEAVTGFVKNKGWANEHDVIEPAPERTVDLI